MKKEKNFNIQNNNNSNNNNNTNATNNQNLNSNLNNNIKNNNNNSLFKKILFEFNSPSYLNNTNSSQNKNQKHKRSSSSFLEKKPNEISKIQIGHYKIEKEIGSGAFGKVYLGYHIPTSEPVAIKVFNKNILFNNPEDYELVQKEIKILKIVKHKYIVQLYEIIENSSYIFIIMEYIEGNDLMEYILKKNHLSELEALKIFQQLINVLLYLHSQNISHRDIKIDNMLLDKKNNLKLIDFGLSTKYNDNSLLNQPCGTVVYAAPEVLDGKEYHGMLADVWSAGIVLYGMLCGYLPFNSNDDEVNKKNVIKGNINFNEKYFNDDIKDLLEHMLDVNPLTRFTLQDIREHKWFNKKKNIMIPGVVIGYNSIPVDDNIVRMVRMYEKDVDEKKVVESVKMNKFDEFESIYYLVVKKLGKEGNESVSDFSCRKFVEFILDKNNLVCCRENNKNNNNEDKKNDDVCEENFEKNNKDIKSIEKNKDNEINNNNNKSKNNNNLRNKNISINNNNNNNKVKLISAKSILNSSKKNTSSSYKNNSLYSNNSHKIKNSIIIPLTIRKNFINKSNKKNIENSINNNIYKENYDRNYSMRNKKEKTIIGLRIKKLDNSINKIKNEKKHFFSKSIDFNNIKFNNKKYLLFSLINSNSSKKRSKKINNEKKTNNKINNNNSNKMFKNNNLNLSLNNINKKYYKNYKIKRSSSLNMNLYYNLNYNNYNNEENKIYVKLFKDKNNKNHNNNSNYLNKSESIKSDFFFNHNNTYYNEMKNKIKYNNNNNTKDKKKLFTDLVSIKYINNINNKSNNNNNNSNKIYKNVTIYNNLNTNNKNKNNNKKNNFSINISQDNNDNNNNNNFFTKTYYYINNINDSNNNIFIPIYSGPIDLFCAFYYKSFIDLQLNILKKLKKQNLFYIQLKSNKFLISKKLNINFEIEIFKLINNNKNNNNNNNIYNLFYIKYKSRKGNSNNFFSKFINNLIN